MQRKYTASPMRTIAKAPPTPTPTPMAIAVPELELLVTGVGNVVVEDVVEVVEVVLVEVEEVVVVVVTQVREITNVLLINEAVQPQEPQPVMEVGSVCAFARELHNTMRMFLFTVDVIVCWKLTEYVVHEQLCTVGEGFVEVCELASSTLI